VLEGEALAAREDNWSDTLYREISDVRPEPLNITLIPYYVWSNRGISEMTVWIPVY
jgi:DUF1680 family protein